jgi:phage terminase large subunit GpA-like protein
MNSATFKTLEDIIVSTAAIVRPPERLTVSEAAEEYRYLKNIGSYIGKWQNKTTPYLIEPMNELSNLDLEAVVFVGPAQSGKSEMILNWITHTALCDPSDFMIVEKSNVTARDFSIRRVARLFRNSPKVGATVLPGAKNKNTFDTKFAAGTLLTISWPTINELSGKPIPRVALTDYDRMDQDVDGEGSPFDLAKGRTKTFRRFAMTLCESSPGFEQEKADFIATSKHEAPPTKGILALYNRGDRRRYYWKCVSCHEAFEPKFKYLVYPDTADIMEAAEQAVMACPHCGQIYRHDGDEKLGTPSKDEMNGAARWLKDGQLWLADGTMSGTPMRSKIGSFWLPGVCAHFSTWSQLVANYLNAKQEYERTGSEEALKTTTNIDQGDVYLPVAARADRSADELMGRAQPLGERVVPEGVRFMVATIDVQKNRFAVMVTGVGMAGEMWIVDRFDIKKSERVDPDTNEHFWIAPHTHLEDWRLLIPQVIERTYPLGDGSGRLMEIKHTVCDSGGKEGVTANAYQFWRELRDDDEGRGHHTRFRLLKGASNKEAPRVQTTFPDTERKDRRAAARGEVPVLMINPNMIKDQVANILDRKDPNGWQVNFPDWLPAKFYTELTAEVRTPKGWENPKMLRNEAWDLLCYAVAASISPPVAVELIDWTNPPGWAKDWGTNILIRGDAAVPVFQKVKRSGRSLEDLGSSLA